MIAASALQLSTEGGIQPKWRRDGRELFYLAALGDLPEVGKPQRLFATRIEATTGSVWHQYDVTPDGWRFLLNVPDATRAPLTVVVNWPALLKS